MKCRNRTCAGLSQSLYLGSLHGDPPFPGLLEGASEKETLHGPTPVTALAMIGVHLLPRPLTLKPGSAKCLSPPLLSFHSFFLQIFTEQALCLVLETQQVRDRRALLSWSLQSGRRTNSLPAFPEAGVLMSRENRNGPVVVTYFQQMAPVDKAADLSSYDFSLFTDYTSVSHALSYLILHQPFIRC